MSPPGCRQRRTHNDETADNNRRRRDPVLPRVYLVFTEIDSARQIHLTGLPKISARRSTRRVQCNKASIDGGYKNPAFTNLTFDTVDSLPIRHATVGELASLDRWVNSRIVFPDLGTGLRAQRDHPTVDRGKIKDSVDQNWRGLKCGLRPAI